MKRDSKLTVSDLWEYARTTARIESKDYIPPEYATQDDVRAWRGDIRHRTKAKRAAQLVGNNCHFETPLLIGKYFGTRLTVTKNLIEYCPGQYAPTEIYWALEDYFKQYYRSV